MSTRDEHRAETERRMSDSERQWSESAGPDQHRELVLVLGSIREALLALTEATLALSAEPAEDWGIRQVFTGGAS